MRGRSKQAYTWGSERTQPVEEWLVEHVCEPVEANPARVLVVAGALLVAVAGYVNPGTFLNSISAELFGIVIAAVVVDAVNERRQDQLLKERLIIQLGSHLNDVTDTAARTLRARGWLTDGSLDGARLDEANLERLDLSGCRLCRASLLKARLEGAKLGQSDLTESEMIGARLDDAKLLGANLVRANLRAAKLNGAEILVADLTGADLHGAEMRKVGLIESNLCEADLANADLSEAHLERACLRNARLREANLFGTMLIHADLDHAILSGIKNWTIEQLESTKTCEGAMMPDGKHFRHEANRFRDETYDLALQGWKEAYLKEHGGTVAELRNRTPGSGGIFA